MKIIRVRKNGTRHSPVVACCIINENGILVSASGAQYGRTAGNARKGMTNQGRCYYTDRATKNEEDAFIACGLVAPAVTGATPKKRRRQQPHKLPATLQALRA